MDANISVILPLRIRQLLSRIDEQTLQGIEEIRVRIDRPIEIVLQQSSYFLTAGGELSTEWQQGVKATTEDGEKILNLISRHSLYAIEEELRRGYITIPGGHRVGIVGRALVEAGRIRRLRDIRSFNIRVAKEIQGIGEKVLPYLIQHRQFLNTLIISPPRCGKTTLIRDISRILSQGLHALRLPGHKIGLVDERSEIASAVEGVPQNDLGPRVDVLDACPKAEGMMLLIRSMSPDIIVTDEIGSAEDTMAIMEALYAGVQLLTTAHGASMSDLEKRPNVSPLFEQRAFQRYIILSNRNGVGTIEGIYDQNQQPVFTHTEGSAYA
ncbi:stage III sporulation protein AA [Caldalkalibacillus salinus]|uniref:stage III sporulation protein AA n=1 Tax=Caldalkalibacillus salinus TaxID=2803787 RepID=UPI0019234DC4|nr:stage III sporulation protein AA [Caldalkalibacillus salinus]